MSRKKVKICVITTSLTPGGTQRAVSEWVNYFAEREDTEIHLVLTYRKKKFYEIDPRVIIHEHSTKRNRVNKYFYFFKIFWFVRKKVRQINPDTIFNVGYNSFVVFSLLGNSTPLYISNRSNPKKKRSVIYRVIRRLMYSRANGIVAQTTLAKEIYRRETGNKNIAVIPNMVAKQNTDSNVTKKNIILSVGRLIKSKGFDFLIKIFSRANTENWELIILGDGPEMDRLRKLSKELKVDDRVNFKGFTKDVDPYYQKSKIFAFTSLSEGYPNALLEAMCAPLPCISFDCDAGPRDLIEDGVNGFLVPEKDVTNYVNKLNQLISDEKLRKQFQNKSKKLREKHSSEETGQLLYKFITRESNH